MESAVSTKKSGKRKQEQGTPVTAEDSTVLAVDASEGPSALVGQKKKKNKHSPLSLPQEEKADTQDSVTNGEKKKKKKKPQPELASEPAPETPVAASSEAEMPLKPSKKSRAKMQEVAEPNATEETVGKKKKRKSETDQAEQVTVVQQDDAEQKKERKKDKKQKKLTDVNSSNISTVVKNFYVESPAVANMSEEDVARFHNENQIKLFGANCNIKPILAFDSLPVPSTLPHLLGATATFKKPTPIQAQCWPIILSGRDVVGIAKTGSGKTLGFFLPAMVHIAEQKTTRPLGKSVQARGPICLILSPTRELALQTKAVCDAATASSKSGLRTVCIYGGVDKNAQVQEMRQGVEIIVATPGRLLGLVGDGECALTRVTYLVLDEADRMLDLGFEPDIRSIVGLIEPNQPLNDKGKPSCQSANRQTLLFSATWPEAIQTLAAQFVTDAIRIQIGQAEGESMAINHDVKQIVEVVEDYQKDGRLLALLAKYHHSRKNRILVFVLYKKEVDRVERLLQQKGFAANVVAISGDRTQAQRTQAFEAFKDGSKPLLIATDVAARGLDIPDVEYVINYSFPLTIEDYMHRIGRTGRAGKSGLSHTFFTKNDKGLGGGLVNVLREANADIPKDLLQFGTAVKKKTHAMYGAFFKEGDGKPMKAATKVKFT